VIAPAMLLAVLTSLLLAPGVTYHRQVGFGTAVMSGAGVGAVSFVVFLILLSIALPAWAA
jgi:hypothetical protein